jgi:tetratricopeptide (TPR) repeat protein
VRPDGPSGASDAFREAAVEPWEPERFERVDGGDLRSTAKGAVGRGRRRADEPPPPARSEVADEIARDTGVAMGAKLAQRVADAGRAFERERYDDARRILLPLIRQTPGAPIVRELMGLIWYRLGRWSDAITELEAFRSLTGSTEQHPVLADSYRALRRYDEVEALWAELREASPSAELVAEGRIVVAGSMADRGDLASAIRLIGPSVARVKRPRAHQLRLLYVLADLYERAGDVPRARALFDRLLAADGSFADAPARRRALG